MKDESVDLWALDEVHFQQQGSRCRMWVPQKPKTPSSITTPPEKASLEFLKVFREASAVSGRRVFAISDNAQYHRSRIHLEWRQQQTPEFALDFLPPYSPELNPIERVWKLTRRLCLHNRYFGFLESVVSVVESQFAEWTKPNDALRKLCAIT